MLTQRTHPSVTSGYPCMGPLAFGQCRCGPESRGLPDDVMLLAVAKHDNRRGGSLVGFARCRGDQRRTADDRPKAGSHGQSFFRLTVGSWRSKKPTVRKALTVATRPCDVCDHGVRRWL